MVYVLSLQQIMRILQDEWRGGYQARHKSTLIKNNKINMNLLQIVVGCRCEELSPHVVVCAVLCQKGAKK
jgi:hypothetical protein